MQLYYWKQPGGNFGDDINPWLWPRLAPELFDDSCPPMLVGIGTLLSSELPYSEKTIVFGSGAWFGKRLPIIDERFKVYCVRGPETARVLSLDPELAICDPAILMRRFQVDIGTDRERHTVAYMPHHWSADQGDWRAVCEIAGVHYIDPAGSVESVCRQIAASDVLITEAMHGAIVADAFRVPWIPVRAYSHILSFKWQDWCASIGLGYNPSTLPPLWTTSSNAGLARRIYWRLKNQTVAHWLRRLSGQVRPQLSADRVLDELTERLMERLTDLRSDFAACRL